jgi:MFS family permease
MALLAFLLAALTWNYGLGMTYVVVPLYAHGQGLSDAQIGTLFSLPVFGQITLNLVGGAYTDRVGGRRVMLFSACLMVLAALQFLVARGFWMLLAAQLLIVLSRAAFWPAAWSTGSELPGARGVQLGRLNAVTNLGQIAGTGSCGFILAFAGFRVSFLVLGAMGLAACLLGFLTRASPRRHHAAGSVFSSFGPLLRRPLVYYATLCAFLSALPFSLSMSFYPLLLQYYGFSADASGVLIALRAVGSIAASLAAARFVRTGPASRWPVYSGLAVAFAIGALPVFPRAAVIAALMLVVGVGSGLMTLYFQITVSEGSSVAERGTALALGGFGWGVSHLSAPFVVGQLAGRFGLAAGFYVLSALALLVVGVVAVARRWAFASTSHPAPT